jgi:outer membrane lipoprotein-sorting protein
MKKSFALLAFIMAAVLTQAQSITAADFKELKKREDSLKKFGFDMVNAPEAGNRFRSDSLFVKTLVRALKINHSFNYPFDSIKTVSRLYAPDSTFRIFTWQIEKDETFNRQHGAIQMRTPDGSLKLFPLIDRSELINSPLDTTMNNLWWIGNIYYRMILKKVQDKKYYTLIGYDEYTMKVTRKWIDVLSFNEKGEPVFGAPLFSFQEDSIPQPTQTRFVLDFKKDGRARVQYDEEMDMILYDHLISETDEPQKKYTLIPDGDYEGFKWQNNQWIHVNKVFTFKLNDGEAPVPEPLDFDNRQKIEDILNGKKKEENSKPTPAKPKTSKPKGKG